MVVDSARAVKRHISRAKSLVETARNDASRRANVRRRPQVASVIETWELIETNKLSFSRFGDGEIALMNGRSIRSQEASIELAARLTDVAESVAERGTQHVVGLPDAFGSLAYLTSSSRSFWSGWRARNWQLVYERFPNFDGIVYGNAFISRPYLAWNDPSGAQERFLAAQNAWKGADVLIVEGSNTRFGCGNDLLSSARSVRRVLCPSKNAFSNYREIWAVVEEHCERSLVLLALGATATVLALDLSRAGHQAIDVGHLDIEYEWFLRGAVEKVAIAGKASAEADAGEFGDVPLYPELQSQIVGRVESDQ